VAWKKMSGDAGGEPDVAAALKTLEQIHAP